MLYVFSTSADSFHLEICPVQLCFITDLLTNSGCSHFLLTCTCSCAGGGKTSHVRTNMSVSIFVENVKKNHTDLLLFDLLDDHFCSPSFLLFTLL